MKLVYNVNDKPPFGKIIIFALQQLLAIMAATIAVPAVINNNVAQLAADEALLFDVEAYTGMSQSAALFGAGVGTIVYLLFTAFKSPVFLGSSFAFLGSMTAAFAGAVSCQVGYLGLVIGALIAGLVYVILSIIVKFCGVKWINKIMPPVVIGPTVAIIGLSLASNAIGDLKTAFSGAEANPYICLICGLVTLFGTIAASTYGSKNLKLIPFIIGIACGYAMAAIFTVIGTLTENYDLVIINFSLFENIAWVPNFTFIEAFGGFKDLSVSYFITVLGAYAPVAFVVFAEHIADHKNLSSIIDKDLLEDPGLSKTLLGDGVGSMVGAFFGGCPNTTYGESVGCVAITKNASIVTIFAAAILAIVVSFIGPFVTLLATIPSCVMGGVCVALYGFIAVSGLKMIQGIDLNENKNLFTASVILIAGIGGLTLSFGEVTITSIACALILGILVNLFCSIKKKDNKDAE